MVEGISSVGLVEVGGHVDPALVVVYAEGNHEVFGVGFEVEDTRRAAVIHDEDFLAVEFSPDGIFPGSPLEDLKLGASVGLVDAGDDGVRHSESVGEVRSQIVRWGDSHGSDTHLGYLEVGLDAFLVASRLRSSPLTYRARGPGNLRRDTGTIQGGTRGIAPSTSVHLRICIRRHSECHHD